MQGADSLEKTVMLGKIESKRRGWQRMRWPDSIPLTQWTWIWANSGKQWKTEGPGVLQSIGSQRVRHNLVTEQFLPQVFQTERIVPFKGSAVLTIFFSFWRLNHIPWVTHRKCIMTLVNGPNYIFSSVQSLRHIRLFETPWIAAYQVSLSITNSWSLLKLMSIESVMPSSHLILCRPLLLLPTIPPSNRVSSN